MRWAKRIDDNPGDWLPCRHQGPQPPRPFRRSQLPKRFGFDLTNPLAGDIELLADLLQGVLALTADTKPQADHFLFLGRERLQDARRFVADVGFDHGVDRRTYPAILDQVAQRGFSIPSDRGF